MEPYDVVMLIVVVAATVFGAWKGLVWQIASLAAIFVSYFVAYNFREQAAAYIGFEPPWNTFIAMLVLYLATSLGIWIAFRFLSEFIDRLRLKEFDRQIGALLGFAKGVILCVIITLFAVSLSKDAWRQRIVDSRSGYYIALLIDRAHPVMPEEIHGVLEPYIHKLEEELDNPSAQRKKPTEDGSRENLRDEVRDLLRMGREGIEKATR